MQIRTIDTGYFFADGGAMFGAIPKGTWHRRYPCDTANGCILAMRSLLIETDCGRLILVDTGAGNKQLRQLSYYRFFGLRDLPEAIAALGYRPEQVTDVVLTHLHFDHCGYATMGSPTPTPTFAQANHWVSRRQWDNFCTPHPLERSSYLPENIEAIAHAGLLQLLDTDTELCPGLQLRLYEGHTPGQLVPYVTVDGQEFVFPGDVIPLAASLSPDWISAYDTAPLTSFDEKIRLLDEAAAKGQILIYCHDAYTLQSAVKRVTPYHFVKKEALATTPPTPPIR